MPPWRWLRRWCRPRSPRTCSPTACHSGGRRSSPRP
ncbi:CxxxxCH/CxxCH domain-containing protein [Micromonospora chalcea]